MTREDAVRLLPDAPRRKSRTLAFALVWLGLTVAFLGLDYMTGRQIRFPALLLLPLSLVAWRYGLGWGLAFAGFLQIPRLIFLAQWHEAFNSYHVANAAIRLLTFAFVAALVAIVARQQRELKKEVAMLRGILPICMYCKKIRNDGGQWEQLELYISHHSEAQLSHGICAECAAEHYPDLMADHKKPAA